MSFPTTSILDAFGRADEAPLAGGWMNNPFWYTDNQCKLVSQQMAPVGTSPADNEAVWSPTFGPDQEVYITLVETSGLGRINFFLRATGENTPSYTNAAYNVEINLGTGDLKFYRNGAGGGPIGSTVGGISLANGDVVGASVIGTTITAYKNGTSIGSVTDSNLATGGHICFVMHVTTTSPRMDNFGGGEYSVAASPTDIAGKGRAPLNSAFNMRNNNKGLKPGLRYLSRDVSFDDTDIADSDALIHFFFGNQAVASSKKDGLFFAAV